MHCSLGFDSALVSGRRSKALTLRRDRFWQAQVFSPQLDGTREEVGGFGRENNPAVEEIMLTYISLANIFPQYLSAASACCNLNSPNTTGARVTDNYSHCGRHIPGNILQEYAESDRSQTSGVPAGPARDNTFERVIKKTWCSDDRGCFSLSATSSTGDFPFCVCKAKRHDRTNLSAK